MASLKDQSPEKDFLDINLDDELDLSSDIEKIDAPKEDIKVHFGTGVLVYDNKKFAVGLRWLVAEDEGDIELALKRAKAFKADFYCMRQNVVTQHAFAFLSMGHRVGLPVLASVTADLLVGEWHGVFVADNGWWYMAVHADNIAPDGDRFFTSEQEAYNHFITRMEGHRWPRSYAPDSWNIQETSGEIPLSKIIDEALQTPVLKPVTLDAVFSGKQNKNLTIVSGVIVLALLIVSLLGAKLLPSLIPTQAQLPAPDISVSDTLQTPPKEPVIADHTAGGLSGAEFTRPSAFVRNCVENFSSISIPLPGWQMTTIRCKENFIEGIWTRKIGSYDLVEPYLSRFPDGATRSFTSDSALTVTRRLTGKPETVTTEFTENKTLTDILNKRFTNLGTFAITTVQPQAAQDLLTNIDLIQQDGFASVGQNKPNLRPLSRDDLPYLSVSINSSMPPNMMATYFDIAGLVILSIEGDLTGGTWKYETKIILKPEQRLIEANNKAKAMQMQQTQ